MTMTKSVMSVGLLAASLILFATAASAQSSCATDFNGDGVTDEADVAILQGLLGAQQGDEGFNPAVDLNGDGLVSVEDYGILLSCN